jgi:inorganic phosphate transporter, PiT family
MLRRVLSPHIAVAWAAFFNFIAFLFFGLHVAQTIGTGIRVVLACQIAMGLGTLIGGWRIVRTMGSRITRLKPVQGFCAETAGAATLYLATSFGVPVSTTHTITGAITGVGAARRVSAVRWGVAGSIVIAWIITLPAAGFIGALFYAFAKAVS